ncbi:hypothetical protein NC653_029892 [Populus alba x Populus x berolinensis]|uniref:Protein kinase domain-containing protein n=1 Tax=Populus alba x Populus x berolinensis TaxID=444605 RepID=A0AAD6M3N1_9ROSI|nr:hypothetical protein NC653_029892 [Populus alba x Populus x berolinensis]
MGFAVFLLAFFLFLSRTKWVLANIEIRALMDMKDALDPEARYLSSWNINGSPCDGSFEGVACNEKGQVANISLQGKGLNGKVSPAIAGLKYLTGLYLHYNSLYGEIPREIANLTALSDLYLNVNNLSGEIPPGIGNMANLQALKRLDDGFLYENNLGLCGAGFMSLKACNASGLMPSRPEPYGTKVNGLPREIPETANLQLPCNQSQCSNQSKAITHQLLLLHLFHRNSDIYSVSPEKQKLASSYEISDSRLSTDQAKGVYRKNGSPLISLDYPNGWDTLADGRNLSGNAQDVFQSFRFNLEEVETATQYFSKVNLLGKINFSATYRGILRDGSTVAIKSISKSSCKSEEAEFLKGLNTLTSLRHDNLVRLRGFCCSRGRGECFLIYDFVPNGNLLRYLDVKDGDGHVLEWYTRVSIHICMAYKRKQNLSLIHQNITAEKGPHRPAMQSVARGILAFRTFLQMTIVFSALKTTVLPWGSLAPEYTTTGRFTDKSDVYALWELIDFPSSLRAAKSEVTWCVLEHDACRLLKIYIDPNLHGRFFEYEADYACTELAWLCISRDLLWNRPFWEAVWFMN